MKEETIFIADFAGKCIREKVNMDKPAKKSYNSLYKLSIDIHNYEKHLASRRTFPYPVSKEQDGKELREGKDFIFKRQCYAKRGGSCELDLMTGNCECGIIAIPIVPDTPLQPVKDEGRYSIQVITDTNAPNGIHYRITDNIGDNRIATCYWKDNAEMICNALNSSPPEPSSKENPENK